MPSSLVWCSEDWSSGLEQWHMIAQGNRRKTAMIQDGDDMAFSVLDLSSFASLLADSSPCLDPSFLTCFLLSVVLQYFLDLKTPASAGSAPAHQIYRPNAHIIWYTQVNQDKKRTLAAF